MGFSVFTDLITPTSFKLPNETPNINLDTLGSETTSANASTFAGAKQLASDYNSFMREQLQKSLSSNIPGYANLTNQLSQNLGAQLRGELSTSDLAATQRQSAAQALGLGISGSQAGAGLTARNIGLRQYQVQQNAQAQTPNYLGTMAGITKSAQFDPSSMFLSPMQRAQLSWQNQTTAYNKQFLQNQMDAQPAPWERALAGLGDQILNYAASYATMGMGSPGTSPTANGGGTNSFGGNSGFNMQDYTQQYNQRADYNGTPYFGS